MPQHQDFGFKPSSRLEAVAQHADEIGGLTCVTFRKLIEMPKATGAETVKCGVQSKGSSAIATESNLCENSNVDFNKNFYYLRIVSKSGIITGQQATVYGSSLISTR